LFIGISRDLEDLSQYPEFPSKQRVFDKELTTKGII
jgi:hypothetical protein